jgi:hypothetical protein
MRKKLIEYWKKNIYRKVLYHGCLFYGESLIKQIAPHKSILDFGAGPGYLSNQMHLNGDKIVYAYDIDDCFNQFRRSNYTHLCNIDKISDINLNEVDAVVMFSVVQYIEYNNLINILNTFINSKIKYIYIFDIPKSDRVILDLVSSVINIAKNIKIIHLYYLALFYLGIAISILFNNKRKLHDFNSNIISYLYNNNYYCKKIYVNNISSTRSNYLFVLSDD